ncbi:conserved hypothetical protein [Mesorhizobium prunaredense]|uniref:Uncharacterized protein n=1 Tax=Mesorhizobium prunaredense TaxID=1631249 RepID=A0A1R3UZT3_9HYPH|nr:conserved hypothetical protein [Mesorhizobium prunaredense]
MTKIPPAPDSWHGAGNWDWRPGGDHGHVRRRVTEDRVSVSIPSYNFPHSIIDHTNVKHGLPSDIGSWQ